MGERTNFICGKCGRYEVAHQKGSMECKKCEELGHSNEKINCLVPRRNRNDIVDLNFICVKCGDEGAPHRKNKRKCKQCEAEYLKQWKKKTGKQKEYNKKIAVKRRHVKELCVQYLGGQCQYEGGCATPLREELEPCWMGFHFHHTDPGLKTFDISRRMRNKGTIKGINSISDLKKADSELITELDKCILLCSNCHHRLEYCDSCSRGLQKVS